jgi:hypothetical protein
VNELEELIKAGEKRDRQFFNALPKGVPTGDLLAALYNMRDDLGRLRTALLDLIGRVEEINRDPGANVYVELESVLAELAKEKGESNG